MTMNTISYRAAKLPRIVPAIAALVLATMTAIAVITFIQDDPGTARSSDASVSNEQSVDLGRRLGSADSLERQAVLDQRTGRGTPDALDRPVAADVSPLTGRSPDSIDRATSSAHEYGSPDSAERWVDK